MGRQVCLTIPNEQTTFLPRSDDGHRKCWPARNRSLGKQQSWEFSLTVQATREGDAKISTNGNVTEIRLGPRVYSEQFQ